MHVVAPQNPAAIQGLSGKHRRASSYYPPIPCLVFTQTTFQPRPLIPHLFSQSIPRLRETFFSQSIIFLMQ
ncbi:hypothetical protein ACMFMF_008420 [Clarireedia jacksonii]